MIREGAGFPACHVPARPSGPWQEPTKNTGQRCLGMQVSSGPGTRNKKELEALFYKGSSLELHGGFEPPTC